MLAVLACLASLALLTLAVVIYIGGPLTGPAITPTPPPKLASDELNPTPASANFGIQAQSGPTATPVPAGNEPARLRSLADDFLVQGRPTEAAAQYRLILDKYAGSQEAQAALYGLGRASVERERWVEAADAFKKYLAAYPKDALRTNCYYYLGLVDAQLGFWDEATAYYQKYRAEKGPLDAYAALGIAEAYNNTLKPTQAIEMYKQVATGPATVLMRVNALERIGDYYARTNPTEAMGWYEKVLELAKLPEYRAGIVAKEAHAQDAAGQGDKAAALTRQLVYDYTDTTAGFATLKTLYGLKSPLLDDYLRGYYALRAGDNDGAITAFDRFLSRADDKAPQPPTPLGLNAEAQNRLARSWYWLATVYEAKGDLSRAGAEYRDLTSRFPQSPASLDALMRLARLAERQNTPADALKFYAQVIERFPTDPQAETAAIAQVNLAGANGPEAAQPYLDALVQKFPGSASRSELYYDLGKAYQAKNNAPAARAAFERAATSPQVDFYTARAIERLKDAYDPNGPPRSNPVTHPAVYSPQTFAADLDRDRKASDAWLLTWASQVYTGTTTLDEARAHLQADPGLPRIAALRSVGADDEAHQEAKEALERYTDRPLELYVLSLSLSEGGEYYYSVASAKRLLALYEQKKPTAGLRDVPLLIQKLIYPLPFQNIILEQSRRQDFDPLLMVAFLKQESAFDPTAHSGAGAVGLTQVMPETGKGIAGNLDKPDFKVSDLYRPYTAIEFGAYYLAARLKDFDNNPYQALAAYNGGAGNVYRWNKIVSPTQNFDKWIAGIDYAETRQYVEIVYANYFMYRQIYAAPN